jgi:3-deoxy-manno-octulosonate cytidylyltransferase (CMP-KDO synthetase)
MSFHVVIPARFGSHRLPGKPLADIHGKPMIVRVAEAASRSAAEEVVVATDDERIHAAVDAAGLAVVLTRADHRSGSDRVMEVAELRSWSDDEVVLNVQGDEPLIPHQVVDQIAATLSADATLASATLCERLEDYQDLLDPNVVKVVRGADNRALYFSRAAVPYGRETFANLQKGPGDLPADGRWWRHIGVYGYRVWSLRKFVGLAAGKLEAIESLEQLRLLEHGMTMQVEEACCPVPAGVDTKQDLERVRTALAP